MRNITKIHFFNLQRDKTLAEETDKDKIIANLSERFKVPPKNIEVDYEHRMSIIRQF